MSLTWFKQNKRLSGEGIDFLDGYVEKFFKSNIKMEFEKAKKIYNLSIDNDFICPEPIECNYQKNIIKYKYIANTIPIRNSYLKFMKSSLNETNSLEHFYSVGEALGAIHNELKLTKFGTWKPDKDFMKSISYFGSGYIDKLSQSKLAFIHCDYSFGNVHVQDISNNITIYDPCFNSFVTKNSALLAPVYIDLGNFICNLNGLLPLHDHIGIKWKKLNILKDTFISGYENKIGCVIDRGLLDVITYATARSYFSYTYRNRVFQNLAMQILFNFYKGNKVSVKKL